MLPLEYRLHYRYPLTHKKPKFYLNSHHQKLQFSRVNFRVFPSLCRFQCLASQNSRWVCRSTSDSDSATGSGSGEEKTGEGLVVDDADSESSGSDKKREKPKNGWRLPELWWNSIFQAQQIGVLLLKFGMMFYVTSLLRPGVSLPGSEPRALTKYESVPYSEFLSRVNGNQVRKVEVDGVHVKFRLKSGVGKVDDGEVLGSGNGLQESESLVKGVAPTKRIVFTTTRPSDIRTPYEKLLENEVEFGSPDKRSNGFVNYALVCKF